jgi:mannose-1-phosphate guanylyltransferase
MSSLHAVIMAGGSGTRFWPESRVHRPKQLLPITGGASMLAETVARLDPLVPAERVWIVTNARQVEGVIAACPGVPREQILVEPCARNTAPCVGLAAEALHAVDPDATMAVLPADHVIRPAKEFQRSLQAGMQACADEGSFLTYGIPPQWPATGYGYIQAGQSLGDKEGLEYFQVDRFREKPDLKTATAFLEQGGFYWNAGIFMWRVSTIRQAIAAHMPDLASGLQTIRDSWGGEQAQGVLEEVYPTLPSVPVDIGIMEKVDGVRVMTTPYHWSDVGSWKALYEEVDKDDHGNAAVLPQGGMLLAEEAERVLAYSSKEQVIAVLGLDDIVVVRTDDAILVAPRERAEEVKRFVNRLGDMGRDDLL